MSWSLLSYSLLALLDDLECVEGKREEKNNNSHALCLAQVNHFHQSASQCLLFVSLLPNLLSAVNLTKSTNFIYLTSLSAALRPHKRAANNKCGRISTSRQAETRERTIAETTLQGLPVI